MKIINEVYIDSYPRCVKALNDEQDEVEWINWWLAQERNNQPGMRKPMFFQVTRFIDGSPDQLGCMMYVVWRNSISDPGHVAKDEITSK